MRKQLLTGLASFIYLLAIPQQGSIVTTGNSQSDFMKAGKLVFHLADNDFQTTGTGTDVQLFPEYSENAVYWIGSGSNKGNYIYPGSLPEGFGSLNFSAYSGYNLNSIAHSSIHFNRESERIAVFRSLVRANDFTVSWEAVYFKNLFETYFYGDAVEIVDENDIQSGISDSVRIFIIPAMSFKGSDGAFYPAEVASRYPFLKEKLDAFLQRGGVIYTEGNGISMLEKLGNIPGGTVNYSNCINTGTESFLGITVSDPDHPASFNATSAGNTIYSGVIPSVNLNGMHNVINAASDNRPVLFEIASGGGKIICNLGLPAAGGMTDASTNKRQLLWTVNALLYGLSSQIDVVRRVENQLPATLPVGRNGISFDREDTFDVKILIRNLGTTAVTNLEIKEQIPEYFKVIGIVQPYGTLINQGNVLTFQNISMSGFSEITIIYRLCTPASDDPIHEQIDEYLHEGNLLAVSKSSVSYSVSGIKTTYNRYHDYANVMFSARIFADTDVNWKNFLGLEYQPFKVFMIMENKQRTPAEDVVYTQYIPKDIPFYWSDQSLNIPILKTPGGKFIDVLRGSNDQNNPDYDMDSDGSPDAWLDTSSIYPKGYTLTEEEVYWANPWSHFQPGFDEIVYEDIDHDGNRAQDTDKDGIVDILEPGDEMRVWKIVWNVGEMKGYQYFDPYCSYELWIDPPNLVNMAAGVGYAYDSITEQVDGMFYPNSPDIENPVLSDQSWRNWMETDENDEVIWKQLIFQKRNNYEGYTFIDTTETGYKLLPTDHCPGTTPQPHNEFLAVISLGGEEIDMYSPVPSQSMYSKVTYKTIFDEERVTPVRTTYTYWAPLPNPMQFEYLSNNFTIYDTLGNQINYLPSNAEASIVFDMDATTEYTYYWIRNVGYDVHFNDPSLDIDGVDNYGDGVFGYFIYDIPKGMGGYSITLPRNEDGSYNLDSIVEIDGSPFSRWIDNPNTGNVVEIWEDPFEYHVYIPQLLIPPALDDNDFDGADDWIDDRGDRFSSQTGFLHDAFMPGNGEDYLNYPAVPFRDDIYGMVESGWYSGEDEAYGDDFYEMLGKTHIRIRANYGGRGREGSLEISKGGILVVEEIFGGSPWVIFSHVLSSFAKGTDIEIESEAVPSNVKYGTDTAFIRHTITDINEPHEFDINFDPFHLSYGLGESTITTIVGGKDPCSLIEPVISTSSIVDPLKDENTVTLIPDPDHAIPELSEYPKQATGTFIEIRLEVMNNTEDNWINTTVTPVIPANMGNTGVEFSYVAYPRPLVPGDDIGTFVAGWRFNQPEGEVLVKTGNTLNLLQPGRRGYFIFLFNIDKTLDEGIYEIGLHLAADRVYYTGEDKGAYNCDAPAAMICISRKNDAGKVIEFKKLIIGKGALENLSVVGTSDIEFTGQVKWSAEEITPDNFNAITSILPAVTTGNNETIDLSGFADFPDVDTTSIQILQKVVVNSLNSAEELRITNGSSLLYTDFLSGEFIAENGPLFVNPVGPRITVQKRITEVNGYRIEDTLIFEPDEEIWITMLVEATNTGNDISSETVIKVYPGKFYEPVTDSLPENCAVQDETVNVSLGALVPGETKRTYLCFILLQNITDKTELMDLVNSSDVSYEGTSIEASYTYSDDEKVQFGVQDFQLYAATSVVNGNQALIEVTAVNRGLPATDVILRIYPIVGQGIPELPLEEILIEKFDTYEEITLNASYILPAGEEVRFMAVIDDDYDVKEVFELNNVLVFDANGQAAGLNGQERPDKQVQVYPNPFEEELNIKYFLQEPASEIEIVISSFDGRVIDQVTNVSMMQGENLVSWRASQLSDGLYMIRVKGNYAGGTCFDQWIKVLKRK